jgi:ribosomal subunit interface protein
MLDRSLSVRVTGKNLDIGEALRLQAENRIRESVQKYYDGGFSSRITVEKDGTGFRTECLVHLDTGAIMNVSASSHDAYDGLKQIVERITKQLRRDKRKRTSKSLKSAGEPMMERNTASGSASAKERSVLIEPIEIESETGYARPIIAESIKRLDDVSVDEAIERLEVGDKTHYVFLNKGTGRINVVHQRPDGAIGWVDITTT